MNKYLSISLVAICLISWNTDLFARNKHHKKERREERRTEKDGCDDHVGVWEGSNYYEDVWFDNDGEFKSYKHDDRCHRENRENKHRKHHKKRH